MKINKLLSGIFTILAILTVALTGCTPTNAPPPTTGTPPTITPLPPPISNPAPVPIPSPAPSPITSPPSVTGSGPAPAAPGIASAPITSAQAPSAQGAAIAPFPVTSGIISASGGPQNTGIWVSGQGQVLVTPDIVNVNLGVQSQSSTVGEAQGNAANAMNAVVQALKGRGIADKDIYTIQYSITPVMNYQNNTLVGYLVTNMVAVTIRNIAATGSIIDAVTAAGGNLVRVNSISFTVSDPTAMQYAARQQAINDAVNKASQLSKLTGVKLGLPTFISESTSLPTSPTPYYSVASAQAPVAPTLISPGQVQITVNVQIVYTIQ